MSKHGKSFATYNFSTFTQTHLMINSRINFPQPLNFHLNGDIQSLTSSIKMTQHVGVRK